MFVPDLFLIWVLDTLAGDPNMKVTYFLDIFQIMQGVFRIT